MHYLDADKLFKSSSFSYNDSLNSQLFELNNDLFFFDELNQENDSLDYNNLYLDNGNNIEKQNYSNFKKSENLPKENKLEPPKEKSKSTGDKSNNQIINKIKEKKIFEIKKCKRVLGRKRKYIIYNKEKSHTKKGRDNIMTKIKKNVYNKSLKFINLIIKKSKNDKIKKIKLKKVVNDIISVSKKEENQQLLDLTLKKLFSNNLSDKYIRYKKDYNKKKITFIFRQKEKDLIFIFNKTFRDMLKIYCDYNIEDNIFKYFGRLKDDIEILKKKNENQSYIDLYENYAKNYEETIDKIYSRKKRKN